MCGIAGIINLNACPDPELRKSLAVMNRVQQHRGPDGEGLWIHPHQHAGFAHRRLSIIDLSTGQQPMTDGAGNWITFNGEIYNYIELRDELGRDSFQTTSDTEVILRAYRRWGSDCVSHLRGMFAFALWDEDQQKLFCARDRFGIKPFYYTQANGAFYFASEIKALLPFMDRLEVDREGFKDYLAFQFCLAGKTLFQNVSELLPGHLLELQNGTLSIRRYWEVFYNVDFGMTAEVAEEKLQALLEDSVRVHLRSDVPVGSYLSGGLDSSAVALIGSRVAPSDFMAFTGKFSLGDEYDESRYAREAAERGGFGLLERELLPDDFIQNIRKIIYHLDYPVAGPGSFPQFMVSQLAAQHRKVVLGGQGGDEIFGGYTRYLIAYFEQCIKAAMEGTSHNGNFVVTYESIIPNLTALRNYKPLLQHFWREGLFEDMDHRYFRLINRSALLNEEIRWEGLGDYSPFETFRTIFHQDNVRKESYFDLMTHFDFKTLLPALLQVEDRVSMAHGLESRVPLLDHPLVEFAATMPANVKFKDGEMKHILRRVVRPYLPESILARKDKMGFPTPLTEWSQGPLRDFIRDIFSSSKAQSRELMDGRKIVEGMGRETKFGRKLWGLLCLELWQQELLDQHKTFKSMTKQETGENT